MQAKLIIAEDEIHFHRTISLDALGSLQKAVLVLAELGKGKPESFESLLKSDTDDWMYVVYSLNSQQLSASTNMVGLFIQKFLTDYRILVAQFHTVDWLQQLDKAWQHRTGPGAMLLQKILYTLIKVQQSFEHDLHGGEIYLEIGLLFKFIARELWTMNANVAAISQTFTGINFLVVSELSQAIAFSRESIAINENRLTEELPSQLAMHLNILCEAVNASPDFSMETFMTAERLLVMQLRSSKSFENGLGELVYKAIKTFSFLKPLQILYFRIPGTEVHRPDGFNTEEWPDVLLQYQTVWSDPLPEWIHQKLLHPKSLVTQWENVNYRLRAKNIRPEVKFNDLSLLHNKFTAAIPLGSSFLREKDKHDILLELKHELTHIYSLFGRIGISLNAMRVMMVELEKILMFTHYQLGDDDPALAGSIVRNYIQEGRPADLIRPDLYALLYSESSALLEQKILIVEQIWTPWFEGIAVFGELADDPTLDANVESPISTVLKNMVDKNFAELKDRHEEIIAEHLRHMNEMEAMQADALAQNGVFRLWAYLIDNHKKYLPGYLVVRKLVHAWRLKSKRALRGDLAYRLMLHVTRFSQIDILPNLSLPLDEFTRAARDIHISWLNGLVEISQEDLEAFIVTQDTQEVKACGWIDGRLSFDSGNMAKGQEVFEESLVARAKAYIEEMAQNLPGRLPKTESTAAIQRKMNIVAMALSKSKVLLSREEFTGAFDHHSVLSLGETFSPFWLIRENYTFVTYNRTREKNEQQQTAHYTMYSFPVSEEDFNYIEKTALASGETRVQVKRAIVLGGREDQLSNGHHFLIFKLGAWVGVQAAGIMQGREIPLDTLNLLKSRFQDDAHNGLREYLIGPGHPCTKRTLNYINQNDWGQVHFEKFQIDAELWAERAKAVCQDVLEEGMDTLDEVSREMLNWAVGNEELAGRLFESGLKTISLNGISNNDLLKLIYQSGRLPVQDGKEVSTAEKLHQVFPRLCYFSALGWDVLIP